MARKAKVLTNEEIAERAKAKELYKKRKKGQPLPQYELVKAGGKLKRIRVDSGDE